MKRQFTPEDITTLADDQVFVFGSNMNGNHAGGAARVAVEKFGAIEGQAEGLQGQSYAIPTLSKKMQKLALSTVSKSLDTLISFAAENEHLTFFVTKIGCGIAGYSIEDIASVFKAKDFPSNVVLPMEFSLIRGYKGFDKNMKCRDFQYAKNSTFEMDGEAAACNRGFHFCEYPLDVFGYYNPGQSVFCEVEGEKSLDTHSDDSKVACSKLSVKGEIKLSAMIEAAVKFTFARVKWTKAASNSGYQGAASNSGYQGAASNSGDYGAASNSGDYGAASNSGTAGVAAGFGIQNKIKGIIGSALFLTERNDKGEILNVYAGVVDGEKIKADTWYMLVNGELQEQKS